LSNRQEKEKLVLELYREGKNYRQIAKIARISVKDIKPILQKYGADSASRYALNDYRVEDIPISSKAYKLFSEGKSPLQVSIELNLRAPEVKTFYKEYWELRRMHILAKTYEEIGDKGISNLLQLHRSCKVQHISNEQVIEYLRIYGYDLASIKRQYDEVDVGLQGLLSQKYRTEKELQDLNTSAGYSFDILKSIQAQCAEAEKERNELFKQKVKLHVLVSQLKNNNGVHFKLGRFVQQRVDAILKNNIKLLQLSLSSALKTFKDDSNVYRYLYQKSELTTIQLQKPNTTLLAPSDNNPVSYTYSHSLYHHTQKQRPDDFCYACNDASYNAEGISRTYFGNLGKEMIREIGLDSFEGLYNAASNHTHRHY
jgi:hypothetical protein